MLYPLGNYWGIVHNDSGLSESNSSDKGLNDWILDEELVNPLASFFASDSNTGEKLLATRAKERGRN